MADHSVNVVHGEVHFGWVVFDGFPYSRMEITVVPSNFHHFED